MRLLDSQVVSIDCPKCKFTSPITFREIRLNDAIICRGCKRTLQLEDHLLSARKAQRQIEFSLRNLSQSMGNLNITLEF